MRPGDEVISGCVNTTGLLRITTTKAFGESTVAKILDLVENSSLKKAKVENFITKFARLYTPAVCLAALVLAVLPPLVLGGGWTVWVLRALTFLVISCPCAGHFHSADLLRGHRRRIPVRYPRQGRQLSGSLAHTGVAVFDKTGTLTRGVFEVTRVFLPVR